MENPKNLNEREQEETNGGQMWNNNSDSSSEGGIDGSLGIDNLLSSDSSNQDGDESQSSSFSLGDGISIDGMGAGRSQQD